MRTTAHEAVSKFLEKLHVYKSIGDFDAAQELFEKYTKVDYLMLTVREVLFQHPLGRIELQPNLFLDPKTDEVVLKTYDETFEGVI